MGPRCSRTGSNQKMLKLISKTVMLVDDHALFREGLAFLLRGFEPTVDIAQARSVEEAVGMTGNVSPQLILLDMQLRGLSGVGAVLAIKEVFPEAMVVALSGAEDPALVLDVIDAGACGFIPKTTESSELHAAIETVLRGNLFLPTSSLLTGKAKVGSTKSAFQAEISKNTAANEVDTLLNGEGFSTLPAYAFVKATPLATANHQLLHKLSHRQAEVLLLMMQGLPDKLIARNMRIGESTVKSHIQAVFQAMDVHNRTEAVFHVMRAGLSLSDVSSYTKKTG